MNKRVVTYLIVGMFSLMSFNVDAQNDSMNLARIKKHLSGKWIHNKNITRFVFEFENDSTGTWRTENIISTAPLFIIYKDNGKWYFGSIDILGSGEPYPFEIIILNRKKLVLRDKAQGALLEFKRK